MIITTNTSKVLCSKCQQALYTDYFTIEGLGNGICEECDDRNQLWRAVGKFLGLIGLVLFGVFVGILFLSEGK